MGPELRTARQLLAAGGLLAVLLLPTPPFAGGLAEAFQALGHLLLLAAGLRVRSLVRDADVHAPTGAAVALLASGVALYAVASSGVAADGMAIAGLLAAPAWATGVLLTMWSAARTLDATDTHGARTWQFGFLAGVLVWVPLSILFVRVAWALFSGTTDDVEFGADGAAGILVFVAIMLPFVALFRGDEPKVRQLTEEAHA